MTRTLMVIASLLTTGLAFANPTPAQLGKIKQHVDTDAAQHATNKGYVQPQFHVHTVASTPGHAITTCRIVSKTTSWPFPKAGGVMEGARENAVREYHVKLLPADNVHVTPAGPWEIGSGLVP